MATTGQSTRAARVLTAVETLTPGCFALVMASGVAGIHLGDADDLPVVGRIGSLELWLAFAGWLLTFVVMLGHLVRTVALSPSARAVS